MSTITDYYQQLFGKDHIKDGDVISMAEHGRAGGVSTGQPFKFTSGIDEAVQIAENSGNTAITYVGIAAIGSATSSAVWKIMEIDETSGTVITYADSDDNYDNVWDDRESLTYG